MELPVKYNDLTSENRWIVRNEYVRRQSGKCWHCNGDLTEKHKSYVREDKINRWLFPPKFFDWPVHLHHDHNTGMTIGAVHAHCNAVLWQYHGE